MRLFRIEAEAGNEINFRTGPMEWEELPQIDYNYVVHARCLVIDGDLWIDHYNLMVDYQNWWDQSLSDKYEYDSLEEADSIGFHITGSGTIFVEFPALDENCNKEKWYLGKALEAIGADDDAEIEWGGGHITFGDMIIDES